MVLDLKNKKIKNNINSFLKTLSQDIFHPSNHSSLQLISDLMIVLTAISIQFLQNFISSIHNFHSFVLPHVFSKKLNYWVDFLIPLGPNYELAPSNINGLLYFLFYFNFEALNYNYFVGVMVI
jgi:hypothetical protein